MHTPLSNARHFTPAFVLALALLGVLGFIGFQVWQQVRMAPGTAVPLDALTAQSPPRSSDMRPDNSAPLARGPGWEQLNTLQKLALYPLAPRWAVLSEQQKRQWLVMAQSFSKLPEAEQERLHNRMTQWASLSAQQRSQARLNYAATNRLAPDSKRAQWEAYQALSEEEKKRLAAKASAKPTGAAPALHPVPARKLARVPAAKEVPPNTANPPKITQPTNPRLRPLPPSVPPPSLEPLPPPPPVIVETLPIATPSAQGSALQPLEPLPEAVPAHDAGHASPVP